jgi:hypothetical protein
VSGCTPTGNQTCGNVEDLSCIDTTNCWASADGSTAGGGTTTGAPVFKWDGVSWTAHFVDSSTNSCKKTDFDSVAFSDAQHGYVAGEGGCGHAGLPDFPMMFSTADGGLTWTEISLPPTTLSGPSEIHAIGFADPCHGWAVGEIGTIFAFTDPAGCMKQLTVTKTGTGAGSVSSSPAGIDCGATCQASFDQGTHVQLTASPDASSDFTGWTGDCTGTGACDVTMDTARSVTAAFALKTETLTVTVKGKGKVSSTPAGIGCPADCTEGYPYNTSVKLTEKPKKGWHFVKWTGSCIGKTSTCTLLMTDVRAAKATFAKT